MLKSTHKAAPAPAPLPPNWTEHKAPTGHSYYYNSETKQSTYTRPTIPAPEPEIQQTQPTADNPFGSQQGSVTPLNGQQLFATGANNIPTFHGSFPAQHDHTRERGHRGPRRPEDRPKHKREITGCEPWILVSTKLRRRFVYNPEKGESFWKFPQDVMLAVIKMDQKDRERKERRERGEPSEDEQDVPMEAGKPSANSTEAEGKVDKGYDSDEYEEVEVTDDEEEEDGPSKRARLGEEKSKGPVEFDEDDIAYQLAQMGQDLDYEDYQGEYEEAYEKELNKEDSKALFCDLLDDFRIHPFTPWDTIIEEGKIIDDERYTCLPNMKSRKETWEAWSRDRIQKLKEQREKEEKKDPQIPYMALLQKHATPKLYWQEFRRKYSKEPEMKNSKLKDKDREKWYREYINRLKMSESDLKDDLMELLKSLPLTTLNRSTSLSALPSALLIDLRYVSLRPKIRDPLVEGYIAVQPQAPESSDVSPEEEAEAAKQKQSRERREKALAERERRVQEEKKKERGRLQYSKGMLREEEEDVERAMKVGRDGLLGHLAAEEEKSGKDADAS